MGVRATDLVLVLTFGLGLTGCFSPDVSGGPSATDGAPPQADGPGRVVDAAPPPIDACRSCAEAVAAFRFQGTVDDEIAGHHGNQVGAGLAFVPGRAGLALRLGDDASYVHVPDSDTFDLTAGRVSLWFRLGDTPAGDLGLLSRDAGGTEQGGHFNLRVGHDRRVVARIQQQSSPTIEMYRCSTTTIDDNAWHQVEVEFGPGGLTMWVDGAVAGGTSWTDGGGQAHDCAGAWTGGMAGNNNPLVLGALTVTSSEGTGLPVVAVATGVDLDDVELWRLP